MPTWIVSWNFDMDIVKSLKSTIVIIICKSCCESHKTNLTSCWGKSFLNHITERDFGTKSNLIWKIVFNQQYSEGNAKNIQSYK